MDWTLRKPPLPLGEGWGEGLDLNVESARKFQTETLPTDSPLIEWSSHPFERPEDQASRSSLVCLFPILPKDISPCWTFPDHPIRKACGASVGRTGSEHIPNWFDYLGIHSEMEQYRCTLRIDISRTNRPLGRLRKTDTPALPRLKVGRSRP